MKVAYFGYNAFSSCLDVFTQHGHEVVAVFTGKNSPHTDQVIAYAKKNACTIAFDKPTLSQLEKLINQGVELFFAAEYPWLIPLPQSLPFAINAHPTLLPFGKGPTPLPTLILKSSEYAGVTFHKMTSTFDDGEILLQNSIPLSVNESFDSLSAKLTIETPLLLNQLLSNLDHYYYNSTPQGEGSYWPKLTQKQQTLRWSDSTSNISKQLRAYGSLGVYSEINHKKCLITAAECETHPHEFSPGTVLCADTTRVVITTSDGFVSIPRNHLLTSQHQE